MKIEFIAEIGMNHNGNFGLAFELLKQAKDAGADIAKFQLGWRSEKDEINHIDKKILTDLKQWGEYFEIELMFSIFTREAFELIKQFDFGRYKIASRTLIDDFDLVEEITAEGKPTYISLGEWNKSELPNINLDNVYYLWCRSKYPTSPWDLKGFPKDFSNSPYYGYSDHCVGIETCILAISRGANIIEKHFTLDKSDVTIRDHALSATPEEFSLLTRIGKDINKKLQIGI